MCYHEYPPPPSLCVVSNPSLCVVSNVIRWQRWELGLGSDGCRVREWSFGIFGGVGARTIRRNITIGQSLGVRGGDLRWDGDVVGQGAHSRGASYRNHNRSFCTLPCSAANLCTTLCSISTDRRVDIAKMYMLKSRRLTRFAYDIQMSTHSVPPCQRKIRAIPVWE